MRVGQDGVQEFLPLLWERLSTREYLPTPPPSTNTVRAIAVAKLKFCNVGIADRSLTGSRLSFVRLPSLH